jgi:two-component system response regulator DesR
VGELASPDDLTPAVLAQRPHVTIVDLALLGPDGLTAACALASAVPDSRVLVLAESRRSAALRHIIGTRPAGVSVLANDAPAERLVAAVRQAACGESVLDPDLVLSALRSPNPLTLREIEILAGAAKGQPAKEIAETLTLSPGTVRNHLSHIMAKTGARTKIEAIRLAQESGWI